MEIGIKCRFVDPIHSWDGVLCLSIYQISVGMEWPQ